MTRKEVEYLELSKLRDNPRQPPARTEPHNLKSLVSSIRRDGLQYPILVSYSPDGSFTIIDGHRRAAALRSDGHELIPCIRAEGQMDHLFAVVAGTQKKLTSLDWATIFVNNGEVPSNPTKTSLVKLRELIGNDGIKEMIGRGVTPQVYQVARRTIKYVHDGDERQLKPTLLWLIKHKQSMNANSVISNQQSADIILRAIKDDQPIRF